MALWGTEKTDEQTAQAELTRQEGASGRYTGAELLVRFLESRGVRQLYGIPGAGILPFYDAIRSSDRIQSYNVRHEQTAIFMADGYSRVTGKVGVCAATSGPGATNFLTGLYSAFVDSVPLLAITGQVPTSLVSKDAFQEAPIVAMAQPVCKAAYMIEKAADLPRILQAAWNEATTGRPGPILLDLPLDVQKGTVEVKLEEWLSESPKEILSTATGEEVHRAFRLLLEAENPVIQAGGGIVLSHAEEGLRQLAEGLSLPVVSTLMGKDSFPNDHPLYAGVSGTMCQTPLGNQTISEADLILCLGGRFADRNTGDTTVFRSGKKIIHINIDPKELNRHFPADLAICSDAADFLQKLNALVKEVRPNQKARVRRLQEERVRLARKTDFATYPMKPQRAIAELRHYLDRDAIVTHDCGISQIFSAQLFEAYEPRTYLTTGRAGTMGWGLGAAMAAKLAQPEKQCVNLLGDGSLGMSLADLATAAKHNIPIVVFLLNNSLFGLIRQQQNLFFAQRRISTDLDFANLEMGHDRGIDFVTTARGLGVAAERVERPEEIKAALARAFAAQRPYLLEVLVDPEAACSVSLDGTLSGVAEMI